MLFSPDDLVLLAGYLDIEIQLDRGHALIYTLDCAMRPARDLVVAVPGVEGATPVVFRDGSPVFFPNYTDDSGQAGFVNLPEGRSLIEASLLGEAGSPVLQSEIVVRPGTVSHLVLWPQ